MLVREVKFADGDVVGINVYTGEVVWHGWFSPTGVYRNYGTSTITLAGFLAEQAAEARRQVLGHAL